MAGAGTGLVAMPQSNLGVQLQQDLMHPWPMIIILNLC